MKTEELQKLIKKIAPVLDVPTGNGQLTQPAGLMSGDANAPNMPVNPVKSFGNELLVPQTNAVMPVDDVPTEPRGAADILPNDYRATIPSSAVGFPNNERENTVPAQALVAPSANLMQDTIPTSAVGLPNDAREDAVPVEALLPTPTPNPILAQDPDFAIQGLNAAQTTGDANTEAAAIQKMSPIEYATKTYNEAVNAPVEKQAKWKDFLAYAIQGLNAAVNPNPNNRIESYGEIKKNRAIREEMQKLAPLQQQADFALKQKIGETQARNSDERIRQADERIKTANQKLANNEYNTGFNQAMAEVKLGYKKGTNPVLDEKLKRYGIDLEQYDTNNQTFWQGQNYMTFNERGEAVPVLKADGTPITDPTRAPVTVTYDGQAYTVPMTVAYQGATNTGYRNTQIKNQDIDDENDYKDKVTKWEIETTKAGGDVSAIDNEIVGLRNKEAELKVSEEKLTNDIDQLSVDEVGNKDAISAKRTELKQVQTDRRDTAATLDKKKGDLSKAQQTYEGLQKNKPVKPTKRTQTEMPQTTNVGGVKYTVEEVTARVKRNNPNASGDELKKLIENGITATRNAGALKE